MRIPKDIYPAQVITTDPNYPHGKAKNESAPMARDGWPLEEKWVNDLLGWTQALLNAAGITPDGTAEQVGASQLLAAIQYIATHTDFVDAAQFDDDVQIGGDLGVTGGIATGLGLLTAGSGLTVFGQALLNGTFRIAQLAQMVSAIEVTRPQALTPVPSSSSGLRIPEDWDFGGSGRLGFRKRITGTATLYLPLDDLPDGSTLKSVTALVSGDFDGVGHSQIPATPPSLKVEYVDAAGDTQTPTPTANDPSGSVGAFNDPHTITCTLDTPLTIDNASAPKRIYAVLGGGSSTGAKADAFGILGLSATFDCDQVNP